VNSPRIPGAQVGLYCLPCFDNGESWRQVKRSLPVNFTKNTDSRVLKGLIIPYTSRDFAPWGYFADDSAAQKPTSSIAPTNVHSIFMPVNHVAWRLYPPKDSQKTFNCHQMGGEWSSVAVAVTAMVATIVGYTAGKHAYQNSGALHLNVPV
jgi:hypothetical protein